MTDAQGEFVDNVRLTVHIKIGQFTKESLLIALGVSGNLKENLF